MIGWGGIGVGGTRAMKKMSDDSLVTVATDLDGVGAAILQSKLEAVGIESCLVDGNTPDVVWYLAHAIGGAKIQVRMSDEPAAMEIVEARPEAAYSEDAEWAPPRPGVLLMDRSVQAGLLGVLFFPLSIYSLWLFLRALMSKGGLASPGKCAGVLVINAPLIVMVTLRVLSFFQTADTAFMTGGSTPDVLHGLP